MSTETPFAIPVPEACERLGISRSFGYEMVRTGKLPSVRLGKRRVLVPVAALEAWLAEHSRNTE